MRSISNRNLEHQFGFEPRESRLRKMAGLIRPLAPGKLLDMGCQRGEWTRQWLKAGWTCCGVDLNPQDVQVAQAGGIQAEVCDLNSQPLPFQSDFFDLVIAGEMIEHLADTSGFLQEARRVLKPGGHFLLTTPNLASLENRIKLVLGKYPRWVDYCLEEGCGHVRTYTPAVLKRQLRRLGFSVVRHTGNWIPFLPQSWVDDIRWPWLAATGAWLPNFAMDIILLARK